MSPSDQVQNKRLEGEIIPPNLAVRAMRDSGYQNTAYALAEIIDNAVQAEASLVELICVESTTQVNQRRRKRINEIGVIDNGHGMPPETLRLALQFGNGTRLNERTGIGRFGMGLPNSSISQCRRLEVWTWQAGPDNAMYSYIDVDEIEEQRLMSVPIPENSPVPEKWRQVSQSITTRGTLVVWSKFDEHRLTWRGAEATLRNTEWIVGRMYRKFIDRGNLKIRLLGIADDENGSDDFVRVNDPLYLMKNSSTPEPFDNIAMFEKWGEKDEVFEIEYFKKIHKVIVRMSLATQQTVPDDKSDRGNQPYGKHAAKNLGVSIVREERELDLDSGWTNSYDPTERWWGVEVEFPSVLDEVFGVTNTKQSATIFSNMAQFDWKSEAEPGESHSEFQKRLQEEGDPRALLLPIVEHIRKQISEIQKRLKNQTRGRRPKKPRHDEPSVQDLATSKFEQRARQGHETESDREKFTEEDSKLFEEDLKSDKNYPDNVAEEIAKATLIKNRKVEFVTKAMEGYAFFNVEHKQGGLTLIVFNTNHPLYDQLIESLIPKIDEGETDSNLLDRINKAADTLELLFAAWARYEMEEVTHQSRLFEMRQEWGKMARFFLSEQDD